MGRENGLALVTGRGGVRDCEGVSAGEGKELDLVRGQENGLALVRRSEEGMVFQLVRGRLSIRG